MVPEASVVPKCVRQVEIRVVDTTEDKEIFRSAQREFFGKNGHRGKEPLQEALLKAYGSK